MTGFAELAERYDGFVIDLWGVLHDGVTAYPGAVECLRRLRDAGKPTMLLSNAPRRSRSAREAMRGMGIPDDLYTDLLTSGEAVHMALVARTDAWFAALGERVLHLGPERDRDVIEGLELTQAAVPREADFVLNTGPDDHQSPTDVQEFEDVLQDCLAHELPMICANPDFEVIRGGRRVICAGALAMRYKAIGGEVRWIGKPDPTIYQPCLERLGLPADRLMGIGDSLRTDIAGAAAAGIASTWVLGGIHGLQLGDDHAQAIVLARQAKLAPVACLSRFEW